jgi:hypothetical protein
MTEPADWRVEPASEAGPCLACGAADGLVVVRGDARLCFTCAMEAGRAAVTQTGFVRRPSKREPPSA